MWNYSLSQNQDVGGYSWFLVGATSFLFGYLWLAFFCFYIGSFNAEEDTYYEDQVVELTEERKFFSEDFDKQEIFGIYNRKGWWNVPNATDELEQFVASEVEQLESRTLEYWEIPSTVVISNNAWIVPENENYSYAVESHQFLLNRILLEKYEDHYNIFYVGKSIRKKRKDIYKHYLAPLETSYNGIRYDYLFSFSYMSPFDQSYDEFAPGNIIIKNPTKKEELENYMFFYDKGGTEVKWEKSHYILTTPTINEHAKF